ncbi:OsmC family protein [Microbulbifer sp. 2201CG32-9]|uniref:OsmC family protein n=1 Tax=Microbulbifer sp. 2201CG32-9 TaxID=3232309 RepID=UPI00345C18AF
MTEYLSTVLWRRDGEAFVDGNYSRGHTWRFDGGLEVPASSSPHIVPLPYSVAENVDPEEAFIAAISSCHMLFFLSIAAGRGLVVDEYRDEAQGVMEKVAGGGMAITRVTLRPQLTFAGDRQPSRDELEKLHRLAHRRCFIANSVTSEVVTEIP